MQSRDKNRQADRGTSSVQQLAKYRPILLSGLCYERHTTIAIGERVGEEHDAAIISVTGVLERDTVQTTVGLFATRKGLRG
mmetsp:Transcript_26461/g.39188  ORF Transcript_26461/g.39188 Transcript_26461/m.39188 type:complete len:81 (+) Transcript_26461:1178-1420(+)